MTRDPSELVSRYLDDVLTEDEHRDLQDWLRSSPDHAREFAQIALLHDRLRVQLAGEFTQKGRDATVEVLLEIHGVPGSGKSPDFTR